MEKLTLVANLNSWRTYTHEYKKCYLFYGTYKVLIPLTEQELFFLLSCFRCKSLHITSYTEEAHRLLLFLTFKMKGSIIKCMVKGRWSVWVTF